MIEDLKIEKANWKEFVAEGLLEIGPKESYFIFLDGDFLSKLLLKHFDLPTEKGYTSAGRVRISVQRIEE